jgi:uncharacterized protein (TIGR03084 family)
VDDIRAALRAQHAELAGHLTGLSDDDWHRPTRCEGWDVYDVVLHLAQTDEYAVSSLRDEFEETVADMTGKTAVGDVDDAAGLMVEQERGRPPAELFDRWRRASDGLRAELDGADPHKRVAWVTGRLSVQTLATTRLSEAWIHSDDVAEALGKPLVPSDRLQHIARLAWRTVPYAFIRDGREPPGPVAFELRGPGGEQWDFVPDAEPITVIRGEAAELCAVAAQRVEPAATSLRGDGPDADTILELVRTYA